MSEARSFINQQTQTYASLKASTPMSANQRAKFDTLNVHIANSVVVSGELVIVGDPSTPACTSHEAFLMGKARRIHLDLMINGAGADDFFLENFELLKSLIAHASVGVGVVSEGWSKHLEEIRKTLEDIDALYRRHLVNGAIQGWDEFYASRAALFERLDTQLGRMAAFGSGLRREGTIKRMLGISTKRYLQTGEISRYAEKVAGVAKAADLVKKGAYVGVALDVASTSLSIHQACTLGREEDCKRAKYIEGSSLAGSLVGAAGGGTLGSSMIVGLCTAAGVVAGGVGSIACAVVGGAAGGIMGGNLLGEFTGNLGELIYGGVYE